MKTYTSFKNCNYYLNIYTFSNNYSIPNILTDKVF